MLCQNLAPGKQLRNNNEKKLWENEDENMQTKLSGVSEMILQ